MKARKWQFIGCTLGEEEALSKKPLPKETTALLVYGFRTVGGGRDNHVGSELIVLEP